MQFNIKKFPLPVEHYSRRSDNNTLTSEAAYLPERGSNASNRLPYEELIIQQFM